MYTNRESLFFLSVPCMEHYFEVVWSLLWTRGRKEILEMKKKKIDFFFSFPLHLFFSFFLSFSFFSLLFFVFRCGHGMLWSIYKHWLAKVNLLLCEYIWWRQVCVISAKRFHNERRIMLCSSCQWSFPMGTYYINLILCFRKTSLQLCQAVYGSSGKAKGPEGISMFPA